MKCKFCDAELEDGNSVCPACGRDNQVPEEAATGEPPVEETREPEAPTPDALPAEEAKEAPIPPKKGMTPGKIALIVTLSVVALALVVALVLVGVKALRHNETTPTDPSGSGTETTEGTIPPDGNPDDVTCKGSYTVSDEELLASRDTVVATMGEQTLTVGQLQVYYWRSFYDFMNSYGNYAIYLGLDFTQPLDTQTVPDSTFQGTWQQYFLQAALADWQRYGALTLESRAAGLKLEAEQQDYLDNLEEHLTSTAQSYGFEDCLDMLQSDMGAAATVEDYHNYVRLSYEGYLYFSEEFDKIVPTEAEIEEYFNNHTEDFSKNEITKDSGNYVTIRHILVKPEGGTTGEDGSTTYSDEEWEACRTAAQEILDTWLAGDHNEESFAALATEKSEDPGSKDEGGLYENVKKGEMVTEFNDWCFDEARQPGDYGLVKTEIGYHVMFFCSSEPIWHLESFEALMNELSGNIITTATEAHPMEVDYSAICLGFVDQNAHAE